MAFNSYDTNSVCTVIVTNVILDSLYLFYAVHLLMIFIVKFNSTKELVHFCLFVFIPCKQWRMTDFV